MSTPDPASSVHPIRKAGSVYIEQQAATLAPDKFQVLGAVLATLLGPALAQPIAALTPLRFVLLSGLLKARICSRTGRQFAASTFMRYTRIAEPVLKQIELRRRLPMRRPFDRLAAAPATAARLTWATREDIAVELARELPGDSGVDKL